MQYLWLPVLLYISICLCLSPPLLLQQLAEAAGVAAAVRGSAASPYLLLRLLHRLRSSYALDELFAVSSFSLLFCCLFIYKHIINCRNNPKPNPKRAAE